MQTRIARLVCACEQSGRRGRTTEQQHLEAGGRRPAGAVLEQPRQHRRHEGDAGDVAGVERVAHGCGIELRLQADRASVHHAARENRESADVKQRHAGKPAPADRWTESIQCRDGAGLEVLPAQAGALRPTCGAGREQHGQSSRHSWRPRRAGDPPVAAKRRMPAQASRSIRAPATGAPPGERRLRRRSAAEPSRPRVAAPVRRR